MSQTQLYERETLVMKNQLFGSFGSKLTFTIGSTYMSFGVLGFLLGGILIKKPMLNFPTKKLLLTYYINNMMQKGLTWANNSGGAAFLYCFNGWLLTKYQEEIPFLKDNL